MSTLVTHTVHTQTQAIVHTQTHNNIWLRKRTISTLDWERGQSRHSIEKEDNLDTRLRKRTIWTLDWERGQSEHSIEKEDNLDTTGLHFILPSPNLELSVIMLSPCCPHVIIPTSLSPRHCPHVTVPTSLSPHHCPYVIVTTSLYSFPQTHVIKLKLKLLSSNS